METPRPFDAFVILAGMRTGSNLLQEALNSLPGLACFGEVFNPDFVESPGRAEFRGLTRAQRDADPLAMLQRLRAPDGPVTGFRLFAHHDARVLEACLADRRCAKVVLTRHPVDSFASLMIAQATDQWQLGDPRDRQSARAPLDPPEFAEFLLERAAFHRRIQRVLQATGQVAFVLDYDDLAQPEVIGGLARFLTGAHPIGPPRPAQRRLVRQNPGRALDKFADPAAAAALLSDVDWFDLARTPLAEPLTPAPVLRPALALGAPLALLPVAGVAGQGEVRAWMAGLRAPAPCCPQTLLAVRPEFAALLAKGEGVSDMPSPGLLEAWLAVTAGARQCLAVIEHPLPRAYRAWRKAMHPLPGFGAAQSDSPLAALRDIASPQAAFAAFLRLVADCLEGQYPGFAVPPEWLRQGMCLDAQSGILRPDRLIRASTLATTLPALAQEWGWQVAERAEDAPLPGPHPAADPLPAWCADPEITALAQAAYGADYRAFGFGPTVPAAG